MQPEDFGVEWDAIPIAPEGGILVRNLFVSVDPMLRLFVDKAPPGSKPPLPLGSTVPGAAVGKVVKSNHPQFKPGELVEGRFGWCEYAVSQGAQINRVPPDIGPPENALAIGGLPGFTAYVGLQLADLEPGQSILVSGAAGAVGSAVGTFVHARGARAVGIIGGPSKRDYVLNEAGYAAAVDRTAPDFEQQLTAALPQGAQVYFDNVGGPLLAKVAPRVNRGGLVLICGLMAQYEGETESGRPQDLYTVLRAVMGGVRMQGFTQYGQDELRPDFEREVASLVTSGRYAPKVHVLEGIEALPDALWGLFNRSVAGKVVVRVGAP